MLLLYVAAYFGSVVVVVLIASRCWLLVGLRCVVFVYSIRRLVLVAVAIVVVVATLLVVVLLIIASAVSMLVRDCKHIVGLLVLLLAGWLSGFVHLFSSEYFAVMLRRSLRS